MQIEFVIEDYESVRKLIDITLSENELPEAVIALSVYEGEAVEVITDALSSLTEEQATDNAATIKRAALRLTASYLAPKIPQLTSEVLEGDKFTFAEKDFAKISADLETQAFNIVNRLLKKLSDAPKEIDTSFPAGLFTTAKACPK